MNVFILCSGRCGSTTFIKACQHITNYTAAHESRIGLIGNDRVAYPDNHIEADNRLAWFLGKLDMAFGDNAVYVHLYRNKKTTAESFAKRFDEGGIISAYKSSILYHADLAFSPMQISEDYCDTIGDNIRLFLKDKTNTLDFELESAQTRFSEFWDLIKAEGNRELALREWDSHYNASAKTPTPGKPNSSPLRSIIMALKKCVRIAKKTPQFIKHT